MCTRVTPTNTNTAISKTHTHLRASRIPKAHLSVPQRLTMSHIGELCGHPAKTTVPPPNLPTAGVMQNTELVFNIQNNFSNMLFPRISLLGQIIQLSVCLLLIPKLGGSSTYHLFCRLVFLQNTTIKIALAVIKMAQRQIWRRAKDMGK